ncbi:hypothetical protein ACF06W_11595 [Streptomyces albus]|uniref:hypothetical protein n=1 Tax=Streptomyces albus TaxID=1888 RepID=UPI0037026393
MTLGVFGAGELNSQLACDALNDQFEFGPEDSEGYFGPSAEYDLTLYLPAGGKITSPGVHTVWEWAIRCELPYLVLWDESGNARTVDVLGNVDKPEDIHITSDVPDALLERLREAENPMLLVISSNEQFDSATAELAAQAMRCEIPVYDLSRALLEVTWRHLPDHEPPSPDAAEVEDEDSKARSLTSAEPEITLTAKEAAAISSTFTRVEELIDNLEGVLMPRIHETREALIHGRSLLTPKPEVPAEGQTSGKTRLEIFDAKKGEWVPAGRGRPPKGAQKRRVPA